MCVLSGTPVFNEINANRRVSSMLNTDLLQVTNTPNQAIKPTDNETKQSEDGGCNKEKFEDSLEKAFKAFSTKSDD